MSAQPDPAPPTVPVTLVTTPSGEPTAVIQIPTPPPMPVVPESPAPVIPEAPEPVIPEAPALTPVTVVAPLAPPTPDPTPVTVVTAPVVTPPDPVKPAVTVVTTPLPPPGHEAETTIAVAPTPAPPVAVVGALPPPSPQQPTITTVTTTRTSRKHDIDTVPLIIISILCPALAVYLVRGCGWEIPFNILLGLMLGLPAVIQAIYFVLHDDPEYMLKRTHKRAERMKKKKAENEDKIAEKEIEMAKKKAEKEDEAAAREVKEAKKQKEQKI